MPHYCKMNTLKDTLRPSKMKLSIILSPALEKIMVSREKCRLIFLVYLHLTGKWSLNHFLSFPEWNNYNPQTQRFLLRISFCNIYPRE